MEIATAEPILDAVPPRRLTKRTPDVSFHLTLLGLSAAVIVLAVILRIEGERQVVLPVVGIPLPGVCTSQRLLGLDCPGCGFTRSFISLGHGDFQSAWQFNPAGILGFLFVLAQIPYRTIQWVRIRRGQAEWRCRPIGEIIFWCFLAALLMQWMVRLAPA